MAFSAFTPREVCIVVTLVAAALLALRPPRRVSLVVWGGLLVAGMANAVIMNTRPHNFLHANLIHYYLGAKYATIPYENFYRTFNAALGRPQIGMRDLEQPRRFVRDTPNEQRAYYIDLMRKAGREFNALASLPELRRQATNSGVLEREARLILEENLPADRIDSFRKDVGLAASTWRISDITRDAGFNGSPFYTLVRHVDPTLYLPLGRTTAWLNLVWQLLAVICIAWVTGMALGVPTTTRLAMAVLMFASWDFVIFALPGLIFAGLWLPIAAALYAMRRGAAAPAGLGIAWAGLIKLFPCLLLLPAGARVVKVSLYRAFGRTTNGVFRPWTQLLVWSLVSAGVLAAVSILGGRSWPGFFDKILVQFTVGTTAGNNVSLSRGLSTLGIHSSLSPLPAVFSVVSLAMLTAMFLRGNDDETIATLPRRSLILLAAAGWIAHKWLNYYSVVSLLLLPPLAARHRLGAPLAVAAMALAAFLPEFDDPVFAASPVLLGLKLAPYIVVPAWLVLLEFRSMALSKKTRVVAVSAGVVCLLVTGGEAWRMHAIRSLAAEGKEHIRAGNSESALEIYTRLARLSPRNHNAHNGLAVAYVMQGANDNARVHFQRAVGLNPEDVGVRRNYSRFLSQSGDLDKAADELEAARRLTPFDESLLRELALVRKRQGRVDEAIQLLARAIELQPLDALSRKLLEELEERSH